MRHKLNSSARPYRHGLRFEHEPNEGREDPAGGGNTINLEDEQVKAAIDAAVEEKRAEMDEQMARLRSLAGSYQEALKHQNSDWFQKAKALAEAGKPININDGSRAQHSPSDIENFFDRQIQTLQEEHGFEPAQAKGVSKLLREQARDLMGSFRGEMLKLQDMHKKQLDTIRAEFNSWQSDPDRQFRDTEYKNPEVVKGIKFADVPEDVRVRARAILREIDTTPEIAVIMAFGEKGAKPYLDSMKKEQKRASDAERIAGGGGGIPDPTVAPLPADLANASLADFLALTE